MEKLIGRELLPKILARMEDREIIAIRGPRQSGKSTLLGMIKTGLISKGIDENQVTFLSFEDPMVRDGFAKNPRQYLNSFIKGSRKQYFLLDEVQYDREAGKRLKLVYDFIENAKLVVTGSSTLDITGLSKFLVGRVFLYELMPLSFGEYLNHEDDRLFRIFAQNHKIVKNATTGSKIGKIETVSIEEIVAHMETYIRFGGYPAVVKKDTQDGKIEVLKNLYVTYLERDIAGIFGVTENSKIRLLLSSLATSMGGIINYNQLASDTGTYHTNLLKYLGILEDTYVIKLVRPFHKNKHTELRKSPKLYFLDLGLRNYIIQNFNSVDKRGDFGSLLENFVLISLNNTAEPQCYINFWRTLAKAEVDFVFNYVNGLLPIEVKSGSFTDAKITKSMASFIDSYKPENFIVATKDYTAKKKVGSTNVSFVPAAFV